MKTLSITLFFCLSILTFGNTAFAQSNTRTTVTTKKVIKNVRPNPNRVKTKKAVVKPAPKHRAKKAPQKNKYKQTAKKRRQNAKKMSSKRYDVGDRYSSLPARAVRVKRNGRIVFRLKNTFFKRILQRGKINYIVIS